MDNLRPTDPARIGGHRLLGRLGAGGMGVVYLGRTDAGALAAIKVILPEHAGDQDFRTRFRREAEAAGRVDSPWAVSVTGADTEAERPWLATEFVPGPTLFDVVARRGPLPVRSVTVLGRLLARALAAVHAAGLVHRDVKPGNVLLTAGGPRLIDFGIARTADATALTATGLVVGTPGFLPPEQASGNTAGPAGDVFSLGCLLAYAATGRPPFGGGAVDAVLYRTVHDAPDLDGIDDAHLRALLDRCLAKDAGDRPAAADLTGPLRAAGRAQERGVRLAVDRFNSLDRQPFRLAVKVLDDQSDPVRSARVAEEFARDPEVVAVIGPTGDEAAGAALAAYDEAVLPVLTVSALLMAFPARANGAFFQAAPTYAELSFPIVHRLLLRPDVERLGIVIDRSGGQTAYQGGFATNLMVPQLTTGTTHPRVVTACSTACGPVLTALRDSARDARWFVSVSAGGAGVRGA
ncbi:bifunctional serine/threonine-protein kinase/ABC transporter substrate-binding protein, partial [Streptomyces anulatus]|uniref:bifunctional serine/threonine-protein kinase/ABC transporter substrate-binding protein n=1 Tax=Streptomyces anulatus TaxID=1892 RepID=UPI00365D0ED7